MRNATLAAARGIIRTIVSALLLASQAEAKCRFDSYRIEVDVVSSQTREPISGVRVAVFANGSGAEWLPVSALAPVITGIDGRAVGTYRFDTYSGRGFLSADRCDAKVRSLELVAVHPGYRGGRVLLTKVAVPKAAADGIRRTALLRLSLEPVTVSPSREIVVMAQGPLVTTRDTRAVVTSGTAAIETVIVNNVDVPLSAWKIAYQYSLADGRRMSRAITRDVFASVAGIDGETPAAPGGGSVKELMPAGRGDEAEIVADSVTTTVVCAVFADGTWIGSEPDVARIFDQRRREQQVWTAVADAMNGGLRVPGVPGLQQALTLLNRPDQPNFDHPVKAEMRRNLERALKVEIGAGREPASLLRHWAELAEARAKAAASHSRRSVKRLKP